MNKILGGPGNRQNLPAFQLHTLEEIAVTQAHNESRNSYPQNVRVRRNIEPDMPILQVRN